MTRWQPAPLTPPAFRGPIGASNVPKLRASGIAPSLLLLWSVRGWDESLGSDKGRQAIWSAFRGDQDAVEVGQELGVDSNWISRMVERRQAYTRRIASMLGMSEKAALTATMADLVPAPSVRITPSKPTGLIRIRA